jgi:uroporphyrinogen-III decarboxylase
MGRIWARRPPGTRFTEWDPDMPKESSRKFSCFQQGAERLKAAMAGESDRIPVSAQMHEFVAAQRGIPRREFFTNPEIMVPAILDAQAEYNLDVASVTFDVYNIEAEGLGQRVVWSDAFMPDVDRTEMLIRDREDLSRIRTPDFESAGSFSRVVRMHALFKKLTGLEPTLSFCAPFSLAANLRGIEPLLLDIYDDPKFAAHLFDRITEEVLAPWIRFQRKHFPHATLLNGVDATASPPIVNLPILKQWVIPYILRLRELCGPEVCVANWVGERYVANPEEMLDLKLIVGPGSLLGQDPDVEELGPAFYKQYAVRHNLPLVLGIGASFLAQSTPAVIAERVLNYVQVGGRGGRFALYLCNIGASTPPENVKAAIEAAHAYRVS